MNIKKVTAVLVAFNVVLVGDEWREEMDRMQEAVNALKLQLFLGMNRVEAIRMTADIFNVNAVELVQTLLAEDGTLNDTVH